MKAGTGYDRPNLIVQCPAGIISPYGNDSCTLSDLCYVPGIPFTAATPNQWYRFITPIFLHSGIIHLLLNLSFQVNVGFALERDIGWWRMGLIYIISGIGGFIFGAPLSDVRIPTVGASGSLYGRFF